MMNLKKIAYEKVKTNEAKRKIVHVESGRRHVVRVNNIEAKKNYYAGSTTIKSRELIKLPVDSIALFCSEYVPEHFPDSKYITYTFTINGVDYEIEPINAHRNGIKVIRFSDFKANQPHTVYLEESIKSAILTITIESEGLSESPLLSGVKVLYGEGVDPNANI